MRVIRGLGVMSGRSSFALYSFGSGVVGEALEVERSIESDTDDTRLPSERLGANKPLIVAPVFPKPRRLVAGASA